MGLFKTKPEENLDTTRHRERDEMRFKDESTSPWDVYLVYYNHIKEKSQTEIPMSFEQWAKAHGIELNEDQEIV